MLVGGGLVWYVGAGVRGDAVDVAVAPSFPLPAATRPPAEFLPPAAVHLQKGGWRKRGFVLGWGSWPGSWTAF